ncbi:MAG: UvrD-helicase domain-containing protein [Clostridia bacterium]|nr:UvrD-helicase domain-containing protein [Clostridia bacterium]
MAKFSPTPDQKKAIEAPIMDLLVSAAAGSGKTAVLSQRILRLILSEQENTELSRMLVATFTKAAAEELRARIGKALREKLNDLRTMEQYDAKAAGQEERVLTALDQLESAEVSTIHSFCFHLIKRHFSDLGLSASLRIGEEAECKLLKMRVMEETIEDVYENTPEDVSAFEKLTDYRDTGLEDVLLGFYSKLAALPRGILTMEETLHQLEESQDAFEKTVFAQAILKKLDSFFSYYKLVLTNATEELKQDTKAVDKYLSAFLDDLHFVEGWEQLKEKEYLFIAEAVSKYQPPSLGQYRGHKPEFVEAAAALRKEFTADLSEIKGMYFSFTHEDIVKDAAEMHEILSVVYRVLLRFEKAYTEAKSRYGILDYNDLERYACALLMDKDGNPTLLARSVAKRYDAIFIDEYQDTNDMQDSVFSAISRYNRFMVGDIKQSIYGFRGAVPEIFSAYRTQFEAYDDSKKQKQATIFLSDNFRSDRSVISYTNDVFYRLFNNNSGRVPYMKGDALVCARDEKDDLQLPTRYLMVDRSKTDASGNPLTEYDVVAQEILRLVSGGVKPSEIVILLRSMTKAEAFRKALTDLSLPCVSDKGGDFLLDYPEVLLLIALLNVIDNPTRDIYLAASLKSPLFGFTLSELILLRKKASANSLYASLCQFASQEGDELLPLRDKAKGFLVFLEKARRFAELKSSDKVIRYLLQTTPLSAVAVKQTQGNAPISAFYEFARRFESGGFGGVHGLVQRVKEISASDNKEALLYHRSVDLSAVQIMSIHHSKGCEYDYVFLADCSHLFNKKDETADMVYESKMGIGMKLRTENSLLRYDTLFRRAIASKIHENSVDEDMRVLYVALTRAKRQITVVASLNGPKQKKVETFLAYSLRHEIFQHPYLYSRANSYAEWLSLACSEMKFDLVDSLDRYDTANLYSDTQTPQREAEMIPPSLLEARLSFKYPHEALQKLPTKLSVSRLYPGILDDESEELIRAEKADFDRLPLFMQEKTTVSGSEKGTATHLFMQFCNFDNVVRLGVEAEIRRLVEKSFITDGIASLIETDKLKRFFQSDLFARIQKAEAVYREERFHVRLPASEFTLDPEKSAAYESESILVQGVVDCLIRESDGALLLIDYKTDRTPKDPDAAKSMLRERYTTQLSYYKKAVESVFGAPVKETLLYAFSLDDTVEIK